LARQRRAAREDAARDRSGWFVAITGAHGRKVDEVPIADTLEKNSRRFQ